MTTLEKCARSSKWKLERAIRAYLKRDKDKASNISHENCCFCGKYRKADIIIEINNKLCRQCPVGTKACRLFITSRWRILRGDHNYIPILLALDWWLDEILEFYEGRN